MKEISIEDTQLLLDSGDTLKHKAVFIAGYITFKHGEMEGDPVSTEFLQELDRGGIECQHCPLHVLFKLLFICLKYFRGPKIVAEHM